MISVVATDIIVQIIEQIIDNISKYVNENKNNNGKSVSVLSLAWESTVLSLGVSDIGSLSWGFLS